jgi:hypothetical protein
MPPSCLIKRKRCGRDARSRGGKSQNIALLPFDRRCIQEQSLVPHFPGPLRFIDSSASLSGIMATFCSKRSGPLSA